MRRVVIVTGASRGIGFTIAHRFLVAGDVVVAVARPSEVFRSAIERLEAEGLECICAEADVADPHAIDEIVELAATHGRLEVLVNNAAAHALMPVEELPLERWETILRTNLTAPFLLAKAVLPHMKASRVGAIVNIASVGGMFGPEQAAAYGATKAALINFSQALAAEVVSDAIRVNAVSPGLTETDMGRYVLDEYEQSTGLTNEGVVASLQGRWLTPAEIAEVVFWLASPEASGVSGAHIVADLGQTTRLI